MEIRMSKLLFQTVLHGWDNGEFESVFTKHPDEDGEEDHLYPENFFLN